MFGYWKDIPGQPLAAAQTISNESFSRLEMEPLTNDNLPSSRSPKMCPTAPFPFRKIPTISILQKILFSRLAISITSVLTCAVIFFYIAIQVGFIASVLTAPSASTPSSNLSIEKSFFSIKHGSTGSTPSTEAFIFEIPDTALTKEFIFTELLERGDAHEAVAHTEPSESGIPMYFNLSTDETLLLLYRKQLAVRASNERDQILLKDGVSDFLIASIPIVSRTTGENKTTTISGASLIDTHFGIPFSLTDFEDGASNKIRVIKVNGYPRNMNFILEIESLKTSATIRTFTSLALLPDVPMISRVGDHRIGYFATEYTDIGVHSVLKTDTFPSSIAPYEVDQTINVINRWRLEKSDTCDDPVAKTGCVPIKPIIYYVDPTVPDVWQKYVKIGIELWQPAFAALGFKDTPKAVLPGDADFPKDYDSGDIRYASVSFSVSRDSVFSVGPSVTDPRTGEILDADIGFSQEWVHAFSGEISKESLGGSSSSRSSSTNNKHDHSHRNLRSRHACDKERLDSFISEIGTSMRALGVVADGDGRVPTEIIGRGLAGVTVHEVGHTLGLRHNFAGSATIPYSSIYDKTKTSVTGSSSSVMDYIGPVIPPTKEQLATTLVFPDGHTVGEYDRLAIEYGYTIVTGEDSKIQHPDVIKIADKLKTKSLVFATDDDASFETDPLAKRYDLTDDPIAYAKDYISVGVKMRKKAATAIFSTWYPRNGRSTSTSLLKSALHIQVRATGLGAYHLGGRVIDHHYTGGDSNGVVRPVHAGYQEEGLQLILNLIQDDTFWNSGDISDQQIMYVNPYGLGMNYGLNVAEMASSYNTAVLGVLTSLLDKDKLMRINQANSMLIRGTQTWNPPSWTAKVGSATTFSTLDVLRLVSTAVWRDWKYNEWSKRNRWFLINGWITQLVSVHDACKIDMKYFAIDIDVRTIMNEMKDQLNMVDGLTSDVATFINATINKMNKVNKDDATA